MSQRGSTQTMGMTIEEIAAVCQYRGEHEPVQDQAQAYAYIAHYLEDRPTITLTHLAADLGQWIRVYALSVERASGEQRTERSHDQQSSGRSPIQGSGLCVLYQRQSAVYQEILSWAKGEKSVGVQGMNSGGEPQ